MRSSTHRPNRRPPLPRRRRLRQGLPLRRAPHERLPPPGAGAVAPPAAARAIDDDAQADERLALAALSLENALLSRELGRAQQRFSDWLDASQRANAALEAALVRERGARLALVTRLAMLREALAALRRPAAARRASDRPAGHEREEARAGRAACGGPVAAAGQPPAVADDAVDTATAAIAPAAAAPRILCVGGRPRQLPVLQALVERHGGRFAHAAGDGGPDDARLAAQLAGCDVVLLHATLLPGAALSQVADHCRRAGTPCVRLERLCARGFELGLVEALHRHAGPGRGAAGPRRS